MQRKMRIKPKNSQATTARLQRKKGNLIEIKQRLLFYFKVALITLFAIFLVFLIQNNALDYIANTYENTKNKFAQKMGIVVNEVLVEGRDNTKAADILKVVNTNRGMSIYKVDPQNIKNGLETLPWVRSATVQRRLDGIIYIRLSEKQPVALWQQSSKLYLIDDKGIVIDKVDPKAVKDLIILVGTKAPFEVHNLLAQLNKFPSLHSKIRAAVYVSDRRWDLILKNKVKIQLPENNVSQALENLYNLDNKHQITDGRVLSIDMRLPDRSFLHLSPKEHLKIKNGGRSEET